MRDLYQSVHFFARTFQLCNVNLYHNVTHSAIFHEFVLSLTVCTVTYLSKPASRLTFEFCASAKEKSNPAGLKTCQESEPDFDICNVFISTLLREVK